MQNNGNKKGAASRKLEDDDLFKQIGGQLGLDASKFSYDQWQRHDRVGVGVPTDGRKPSSKTQTVTPQFLVGGGHRRPQDFSSKSLISCQHGHHAAKKSVQKEPKKIIDKAKAERLKMLQLRIQTRRQTIAEYRRRKERLLEDNIALKEDIELKEGEAHDEVKRLLRKYEKFRGGIFTLNEKFGTDLSDSKQDLDSTKRGTCNEMQALEHDVSVATIKLEQLQEQGNVLQNYKDKEYPVKQLRISDLQKEIQQLDITHQEDENELQHVVETEIDKFRKDHQKLQKTTMEKVTKEAISLMHPSIKDMAMQNMVMQKEIEFHQKEIKELEICNKSLEQEVKTLLRDPKSNIKMQMFPEFYPNTEKCTPDMEVVLDIPTQEWLPI